MSAWKHQLRRARRIACTLQGSRRAHRAVLVSFERRVLSLRAHGARAVPSRRGARGGRARGEGDQRASEWRRRSEAATSEEAEAPRPATRTGPARSSATTGGAASTRAGPSGAARSSATASRDRRNGRATKCRRSGGASPTSRRGRSRAILGRARSRRPFKNDRALGQAMPGVPKGVSRPRECPFAEARSAEGELEGKALEHEKS